MLATLYLMNVLKNQMMLISIAKRHLTKDSCSRNEVIWTVFPLRKSLFCFQRSPIRAGNPSFSQWTNIWPKSSRLKYPFPGLNRTHMKEKGWKSSYAEEFFNSSIDDKNSPPKELLFSDQRKKRKKKRKKILFPSVIVTKRQN